MALTLEWQRRVEHWKKSLVRLCYTKLSDLELRVHFTHEQLTREQAKQRKFEAIARDTRWGSKWQYAWFAAEVTVPAHADGQRIAFRTRPGGESLVFVNGVPRSSEIDAGQRW